MTETLGFKAFNAPAVEAETAQYHDTLNPVAWTGDVLKRDVHTALMKIARAFVDSWTLPVIVKDIVLTGSNANYNWTKFSDFDVHIVVEADPPMMPYLQAKKNLFNQNHNITVKGYAVEVYPQDAQEVLVANGVYSLQRDQWLNSPIKKSAEYDHPAIIEKVNDFAKEIDRAINTSDLALIRDILARLAVLRRAGLERAGEFSMENMVFKVLRNAGAIAELRQTLSTVTDKELSIESFHNFMSERKHPLTSQQRYAKRRNLQRFHWKTSRRRHISLSTPVTGKRLARRTELAAKRSLYKTLLRGRKKSSLSSTEKTSYERAIGNRTRRQGLARSFLHNQGPRIKRADTYRIIKRIK